MNEDAFVRNRRGRICASLVALAATLLAGCSNYSLTPGEPSTYQSNAPKPPTSDAHSLVGVAISGGGNRSALFASYVLELLGSVPVSPTSTQPQPAATSAEQPISFLDTVSYISSVSGGSFAASYFSMNGIGHYTPMLSGQQLPEQYASFFDDFHQQMNFNWEAALFGLKYPTFGSNAQRLAHAIDKTFLHDATFADLDRREASGASPYLILNATHYDSGRRFVMTTIPSNAFCLNTTQFLMDAVYAPAGQGEQMHAAKLNQCDRNDALTPEGFDSFWNPRLRAVPSASLPLARAVAISGAFPLAVGPVAFNVKGDDTLLHLIDGGVADNSGLESMMQLFLRDLTKNETHRDLVVSLDASLPFNARGTDIAKDSSPLTAFIADPTRPSDIQEVRASLYRERLWELTVFTARSKGSNDAVTRLDIVQMKPDDLNISSLKIDTPDCHAHFDDAKSVHAAARDIPTSYHLDGCSAQLVRVAACWSVHQHAADIQDFFDTPPERRRRTSWDETTSGTETHVANGIIEQRIKQMCPELVNANAL
ncbi:hypothetical protein GCM10027093_34390 [Paraburkholderia jirisanensis]